MAGGPKGPLVGQVTVKVAPDTSNFKRQLERAITKKDLNEVSNEKKFPVKFEIDNEDLKKQINRIRVPKIIVPVDIDRKQVRDTINARLARPLKLKAVVIPVRVDHGQVRRALREAVDRVGTSPETLGLNLDGENLRRQIDNVIDQARDMGADVPVRLDQAAVRQSVERAGTTVERGVQQAVENGVRRARVPQIQVPIGLDPRALLNATKEARDAAARVVERETLMVKLDADDRVLRNKLDEAERRLDALRTNPRIVIEVEERRLLNQIETVQRRLDALHSQKVTPQVVVRIQDEERKLQALQGQLSALERTVTARAEVETDLAEQRIAELNVSLNQLDNRRVRTFVDLQADRASLQEQLDRGPRPVVNVDVRTDRNALRGFTANLVRGLGEATSAVGRFLNLLGRVMPSVLGTAFSVAGRAFTNLGRGLDGLSSSMGTVTKVGGKMGGPITAGLMAAIGVTAQLTQAILALGAISFGLVVAGAAISAAWGAVATAIAAIPAALFLVAGPIGAIALGMDGIKKAAQTLQPEFDRLKAAVSATFERGMLPAFVQLKQIMPTVQTGMVGIADAISDGAVELAKFVTQEEQVGLLKTALDNTAQAVRDMVPGLKEIYDGMLRVASLKQGFDVLTGAVNVFGTAFNNSVKQLIEDGVLQRALTGLRIVLEAVARAFVGLVENGIKLFASAAPGVTAFLDSLTQFFGRFDWDRLGVAVGNVFKGLAETLDGIPQGTIDAITSAFERLGELFRDEDFQQRLRNIVEAIPAVLDGMRQMIDMFSRVGSAMSGLIDVAIGTAKVLRGAFTFDAGLMAEGALQAKRGIDGITDAFETGAPEVGAAAAKVGEDAERSLTAGLEKMNTNGPPAVGGALNNIKNAFEIGIREIDTVIGSLFGSIFEKLPGLIERGFAGTGGVTKEGTAATVENMKPTPAQEQGMFSSWGNFGRGLLNMLGVQGSEQITAAARNAQGVTDATGQGLAGAPPAAEAALSPLAGTISAAFGGLEEVNSLIIAGVDNWALSLRLGVQKMATAATEGFVGVNTAVSTAMTSVNSLIIAGVGTWALSVQLGLQGIGTAITTGFATYVTPAITAALTLINSNFIAGVQTWALSVQLGMQGVATAVTNGFLGVTNAAFLGLEQINQTVIAGVNTWALSMQLGMQQMATAVTNGFLFVQQATFAGLEMVNQTIIAGAMVWASSIQLGIMNIVNTITVGFATISQSVALGMAQANQQIIAGAMTWALSVQTQMTSINNAVVNGFNVMVQTVVQGVTLMNQNLIAGLTSMTASAQLGMQELVRVVEAGVNDAVNILNQATQLFYQAGLNMGLAVAQGLMDALPAVQQAANAIVQTAMMAIMAMAMISSPSRRFLEFGEMMGLGLAIGLESMQKRVEDAAAGLADGAVQYAAKAANTFANVGDSVDPFVTDWRGQLQGAMDMSAAEPSQPLVGTMVVQTPQGVTAKDVMDQALFRLRHVRRGVYSGR